MNEIVRVYSHPRSGTHFLLDLLYRNFFSDQDMSSDANLMMSGHWSKKISHHGQRFLLDGVEMGQTFTIPYARLFGSHTIQPPRNVKRSIYIVRDGRDVALSCFSWKDSMPERMEPLSLTDFLLQKIDWIGSFGYRENHPHMRIFDHWKMHVENYYNSHMSMIYYEDLISNPEAIISLIADVFDLDFVQDFEDVIEDVGWNPSHNKGASKWRDVMSPADIILFNEAVPRHFIGRWDNDHNRRIDGKE